MAYDEMLDFRPLLWHESYYIPNEHKYWSQIVTKLKAWVPKQMLMKTGKQNPSMLGPQSVIWFIC